MENIDLFNSNTTPYLGVMLAILSLIPVICTYSIFKPKFKRKINDKKIKKLDIINSFIYFLILALLTIKSNLFDIKNANIWFGIMCFFYIIYYELYIRYIIRGRAQKELYSRFLYIRIPIFLSMSMSLVFAGIWSKDLILIITSVIFLIVNSYTAHCRYIKYFTEYRDLYDLNRRPINKKFLKDGIQPRNSKFVTVVVFIFNPSNKKWLMQKRTKDKGGKWATTSGHPISGQTSIEGMVKEIKEELGIEVLEDELRLITTVERKKKFADIYYLEKKIDLEKVKVQKEEVDDVTWMTSKDIEAFYKENKFKKTHYNYYKELTSSMKNHR